METSLDKFGRVLIPNRLRRQLNLTAGDVFEIAIVEDQLVLVPQHATATLRYKGRVLVIESEATEDLETAVDDLRNERLANLSS